MQQFVLATHAFSTLCMTGLIWFVQIVHYPMFSLVGAEQFEEYERVHQRLTTWIVAPLMLVELTTTLALIAMRPTGLSSTSLWIGLVLVGIIWLSTAFVQVPAHNELRTGFTDAVHQKLINTNWARTIAWTARGLMVVWWYAALSGTAR